MCCTVGNARSRFTSCLCRIQADPAVTQRWLGGRTDLLGPTERRDVPTAGCRARVSRGHDIPQEAIYRRLPRSLRNLLSEFSYAASSTECYMNLQDGPEPVFIQTGSQRTMLEYPLFETLLQLAEP
jgi:hypothetical protein